MSILFNGTSDWAYGALPSSLSTNGTGVSAYALFKTGATFVNSTILTTSLTADGAIGTFHGFAIKNNFCRRS